MLIASKKKPSNSSKTYIILFLNPSFITIKANPINGIMAPKKISESLIQLKQGSLKSIMVKERIILICKRSARPTTGFEKQ